MNSTNDLNDIPVGETCFGKLLSFALSYACENGARDDKHSSESSQKINLEFLTTVDHEL